MKTATLLTIFILAITLYGCKGGQNQELHNKITVLENALSIANVRIDKLESKLSNMQSTTVKRTRQRQRIKVNSFAAEATSAAKN